jgi:lipocalin
MPPISPGLTPFCHGGYTVLDADVARSREVAILSADPLPPRPGDRFTVDGQGVVREVSVVRLSRFQGGWSAVCRVTDVF